MLMRTALPEKITGSPEALSLQELVYRKLREAILNGAYPPGSMLRQEDVATTLGVSRNPLREALPRLESEGVVTLFPRRGYAVATLDPEEIRDVFDLRILLEAHLVGKAAKLRTKNDCDRVKKVVREMAGLAAQADSADRAQWFDMNLQFHDALMLPAKRPHHLRALKQSRGMLEVYIRTEVRLTGDLRQAQREHKAMADAFVEGDADLLINLTRTHSENTLRRLLDGLEKSATRDNND
jgi:DNA-binding GntR family transcriptional regulator